ncbi:c-type cytochrome [Tundrisphaera lichenicola]|uniref:c-type cytochrome n=1 Tax=Tundrisphaera lichenicola TaxID=2029860 RepID=UPI003EBAD094
MPRIRKLSASLAATLAVVGLAAIGLAAMSPTTHGQTPAKKKPGAARKRVESPAVSQPADRIKALKGFKVELIYTVPRESQGSWVNLAVDPKGRLIASDQYGKLYRVTPPPIGEPVAEVKVEPIPVEIGEAQGLLWAFDSLYVVVNSTDKAKSGLYRVKDTDGDDVLDKVELLRKLEGNGEHGPHAVALGPDGKSIYVVAGNATKLPEVEGSLVPKTWGEDNLLPRMVDGRGFMTDEKAPGGFVLKLDPEGKTADLVSMGYRNAYDFGFSREGDLFTFDSDMEWDMSTPWYRPTRVCMVASGADFGYRNGAGKWPTYYYDSLPPVVNIGPGSPTGVSFGYGAKFPAKYQDAFYISDWSYGKLYAIHLKPEGSAYTGEVEEFVTGTPLPLTDLVVDPKDGAMYFAVGGRRTSSGLYRVTYTGDESTAPSTETLAGAEARKTRRMLEAFHGHKDPKAVETVWPYLSNPDRSIRYAARVALEFQDPATWRDKSLEEETPLAALESLLALVHVSAADPAHREPGAPAPDPELRGQILNALAKLGWEDLPYARQLDTIRLVEVLFNRFGPPDDETSAAIASHLDESFPAKGRELNIELANLMVYLKAPSAAAKIVALLQAAPTQEEQMEFARALRVLKNGWTPELRKAYFTWIANSPNLKGGPSMEGFLKQIRDGALASLSDSEKAEVQPILDARPKSPTAVAANAPSRPFVKAWTLDELVPIVEEGLKEKRDFNKGRSLFAATQCFACHRFDNEGGAVGPDLTAVAGRFSTRDLLESVVVPSKVISDQYEAVTIATTDGQVITGRIMNLNGDTLILNTDMLNPSAQVTVDVKKIEESRPSPISMMPEGLLSTLNKDEIADLVAYLLSRGDRSAKLFE